MDEHRLIINLVNPTEGGRDFTLMAPSRAIFAAAVQGFEEIASVIAWQAFS